MTKTEYREVYLKSPHWLCIRQQALRRAEYRCQVCNTAECLDVHHRTYERLGCERAADLTVLCRACHSRFHAKPKPKPKRKAKKRRRSQREERINAQSLLLCLDKGPLDGRDIAIAGFKVGLLGPLRRDGFIRRLQGKWHLTEKGRDRLNGKAETNV